LLGAYVSAVRIGSFNLHQYGSKKAANPELTKTVAKIINDFDLACIQEITDVTLKAPYVLLDALNQVSSTPYTMALSPRVGDSTTKEQYVFYNREATSGVQFVGSYVYDDAGHDYFERAPYVATYKVKKPGKSGVKLFSVMNVHLRPDEAYVETCNLRYVLEDFIAKHPQYFDETATSYAEALLENVENPTVNNKPSLETNHPIIILGDFNADCSYISLKRQELLRTINFVDFTWVINNQVKTNTRQTCTYDRILINGQKFVNAIVKGSNTTVYFDKELGMTLEEALDVSDHMPVKIDVKW